MTIANFTTPPAALDPDFVTQQITLNGSTMGADVSEAVSDGELDRTILGASTFALTCEDPYRVLLRSSLFQSAVTCELDSLSFTLVEIEKQSEELVLTFEDTVVNRLRNTTGQYTASGTLTRAQFVRQLISQTPGVTAYIFESGQPYQGSTPLARGTSDNPTEDTWTCLQRLANDVQYRCFSDGTAIFFGPDSWLLAQPSRGTLAEFTNGVDYIDFDFDVNKPLTTATVYCVAGLWTIPPGQPLELSGMGIANGLWLVQDISRSIFVQDTVVTLTQPVAALPESSLSSSSTSTSGNAVVGPITTSSGVASAVVNFATAAIGTPYVWGGESPSGYDCSGLTQAAYKSAGVTIPRTSEEQFAAGPRVDPPFAPGDLVFFAGSDGTTSAPGHVGIYIGNNQMIDAPYTGVNVRLDSITGYVGATRPR